MTRSCSYSSYLVFMIPILSIASAGIMSNFDIMAIADVSKFADIRHLDKAAACTWAMIKEGGNSAISLAPRWLDRGAHGLFRGRLAGMRGSSLSETPGPCT